MRFEFSEDQRELQRTVRAFLERHGTAAIVRAAAEREDGFAAAAWERLVGEMELTALAIDEGCGGAGASFVEVGIALEQLGRTLLPVPFLPTVVAAAVLADADDGLAGRFLGRIANGQIATLALADSALGVSSTAEGVRLDGELTHVADGAVADLLVVCAAPDLFVIDAGTEGVTITPQPTLDQTRRQATVQLEQAPASRLGGTTVDRARDLLGVSLALEAVGAASRCLEMTVDYLKERVQFGRPIGSFQALKHRCADLFVAIESARSTAYYAAWAVGGAPGEFPVVAPLAQLVCGDAFSRIAAEAIQLHGGIGFTWEHDAHMFFKRAKSTELLYGPRRRLRGLVGERAGIV